MKEQVREIATEVWQTSHWTNEQIKRLETFAALVGNAKLEEAKSLITRLDNAIVNLQPHEAVTAIDALKEPTP